MDSNTYEIAMSQMRENLVDMQEWIKKEGLKVVVIFEGRDASGKGGVIKRITDPMNPRVVKVVALGVPTERERGQWYFQRYIPYLPGKGEMVIFDRSWYNRAGVEKVMGFCSDDEYHEFLRSCPEFEHMLINSGIILIKYWFSISEEEQERRFQARVSNPLKRWKFSPMDLESRAKWAEYSRAKDRMLEYTDTEESPWYIVRGDDKKQARLNCIHHLLTKVPFKFIEHEPIELPALQKDPTYVRPSIDQLHFVPELY